jgi:hypothetical protein
MVRYEMVKGMRKLIWKLYEEGKITMEIATLLLDELDKKETKRKF